MLCWALGALGMQAPPALARSLMQQSQVGGACSRQGPGGVQDPRFRQRGVKGGCCSCRRVSQARPPTCAARAAENWMRQMMCVRHVSIGVALVAVLVLLGL